VADTDKKPKRRLTPRPPSMLDAFIPLTFLIVSLACAIFLYGGDSIGGPVQVTMFLSAVVAGFVGFKNGNAVTDMTKAAVDSVASAMGAIFILLAVGSLIGTWNMSGTIATMADFGIRVLSPTFFYITAAIVCALISVGIGSAWTVMGTMGVALVAISSGLGLSESIAAGAVVSGAYFGDKLSPLSETTNLAAAVAGTKLYRHIRGMLVTTVPSILIALGIFLFLGFTGDPEGALDTEQATDVIEGAFNIGIIMLLPLALVVYLAVRKYPPTVAVLAGAVSGGLIAVIFQPDVVRAFVDDDTLATPWVMLKGVWDAMATGFVADTGFEGLDELLSGGGMSSMLETVWLIMTALAFGGVMNHCGFLAKLIDPLRRRAKKDKGLMLATGSTAIGINALAADQYLAIVLTGNVYKSEFEARNIAPRSLSRQIEDTATVTSPLIPWNSCGAYAAGVLGVTTFAYLPFAFFNWINPLISFIYAALGLQIKYRDPDEEFTPSPPQAEFYGAGGMAGNATLDAGVHERPGPGQWKPGSEER
jgi:NhaC family Na+:H+ antiporter